MSILIGKFDLYFSSPSLHCAKELPLVSVIINLQLILANQTYLRAVVIILIFSKILGEYVERKQFSILIVKCYNIFTLSRCKLIFDKIYRIWRWISPIRSTAGNNHNKTLLHAYSENNLFFQYQKHCARVTATNCTANALATILPVNPIWVRTLAWIQSSN